MCRSATASVLLLITAAGAGAQPVNPFPSFVSAHKELVHVTTKCAMSLRDYSPTEFVERFEQEVRELGFTNTEASEMGLAAMIYADEMGGFEPAAEQENVRVLQEKLCRSEIELAEIDVDIARQRVRAVNPSVDSMRSAMAAGSAQQ